MPVAIMDTIMSSPHVETLKIGLFGIGLDTYWAQFEGLKDRLMGYIAQVARNLSRPDLLIVNLGLVDTPEKAMAAGHAFRQADVDLIFLYVSTYALSSTMLPVVRRAKVPVVILNLAPAAAIDYESFNRLGDRTRMTGEWLAWCQACPVPTRNCCAGPSAPSAWSASPRAWARWPPRC